MSMKPRGMIHSTVSIIDNAAVEALQKGGSIQDHIQKAYFNWVEAHDTPFESRAAIRDNLHFLGVVTKE